MFSLLSNVNTPAQSAVFFAVESSELSVGRLGRPRMNIFSVLVNDLKDRSLSMQNFEELNEKLIRDTAKCNRFWANLYGTDYRIKVLIFLTIFTVRSC